ncbi:hypothetical protein, partial [Raoultella sp. 18099]|uniref:hypothetical protein n=1 Tax=Raoultella sp. 18099 TaxID=2681431 RepID=UPI00190FB99C
CVLPEARMRAALREVAVFDHPDRSQRGRTITHAHYFDLGSDDFPDVRADDDAAHVEWVPIASLAALDAGCDLVLLCNQSLVGEGAAQGRVLDDLLDGLELARTQGRWRPSADSEARRLALLPQTLPHPWD